MVFQLGSPLLDACVLAVLSDGDTYGYFLTQKVRQVIDISESTLYPVLRRLQKDGSLTTYDVPFGGRNRPHNGTGTCKVSRISCGMERI